MRTKLILSALLAILLSAGALSGRANANQPLVGLYEGAGCTGVKNVAQRAVWLGRKPDRLVDFIDYTSTWANLVSETNWAINCWHNNGYSNVTFSIPMLVEASGMTAAKGVAGTYDAYFKQIGNDLIANGFGSTIIRLGWEHNGCWYVWCQPKASASFVPYWQHLVTLFRGLPGAHFKFDWNTSLGWQSSIQPNSYPGDAYVDVIGVDAYNIDYNPKDTTPAARWKTLTTESYGLGWYATFATQHNKPLSVPEWGTGNGNTGHAGGDDPFYVQQMVTWMATHNVLYMDWFDCCGPKAGFDSTFADMPKSAAVFKQAYGAN